MKQIFTIGGIIAVVNLVIVFIAKMMGGELIFSPAYMVVGLILPILLLVILGRKFLRTDEFPSLNYGEALKYLFPASLIGTVITLIFSTAMFQNDQKMKEAFTDYTIRAAETGFEFGVKMAGGDVDETKFAIEKEKMIATAKEDADKNYAYQWSKLPVNILGGIFSALILSLIASIFVRYKNVKA